MRFQQMKWISMAFIFFFLRYIHFLLLSVLSSFPFSFSPPQLADIANKNSFTHTDKIQPKANAIFRKRTEQTHISNAFICFWIPSKQQRHCFATVFYHSFLHQQVHHCLSACVCVRCAYFFKCVMFAKASFVLNSIIMHTVDHSKVLRFLPLYLRTEWKTNCMKLKDRCRHTLCVCVCFGFAIRWWIKMH